MPYNWMYLSLARACDRHLDQTQAACGFDIFYLDSDSNTVRFAEILTVWSPGNSKTNVYHLYAVLLAFNHRCCTFTSCSAWSSS